MKTLYERGDRVKVLATGEVLTVEAHTDRLTPPVSMLDHDRLYFEKEIEPVTDVSIPELSVLPTVETLVELVKKKGSIIIDRWQLMDIVIDHTKEDLGSKSDHEDKLRSVLREHGLDLKMAPVAFCRITTMELQST